MVDEGKGFSDTIRAFLVDEMESIKRVREPVSGYQVSVFSLAAFVCLVLGIVWLLLQ